MLNISVLLVAATQAKKAMENAEVEISG